MLALQFFALVNFGVIVFQDFKERAVLWILFPLMGVLLASLHLNHTSWEQFILFSIINIMLVSAILCILWLYTKYIAKQKFINTSFGLGDLLFIYAFTLGFPTVTFIILFTSSICFSLTCFFILKRITKSETVPLAGLMGLFLMGMLVLSLFPNSPSLYLL